MTNTSVNLFSWFFGVQEWQEAYICERKAGYPHICCGCRERIARREMYIEDHAPNESFSRSLRFHRRCAMKKGLIPVLSGKGFRVVMTSAERVGEAYKIETDEGRFVVLNGAQLETLVSGL